MGHERSDTPPILGGLKRLSHLGQIPTTNSPFFCSFGNNGYNTPEKTRLHGHSRHNKTTTHHKRTQPRCNKPTSTSGPLTRRRVIIHVEDHTPPKPTDRRSTYRLLRTPQDSLQHSCLIYDQNPLEKCSNLSSPHNYHPSTKWNAIEKNKTTPNPQTATLPTLSSTAVALEHKGPGGQTTWFVSRSYQQDPTTLPANHNLK